MTEQTLSTAMKSIPVDLEIVMGMQRHRIRAQWVGHREGEYLVMDLPRKYAWIDLQDWLYNATSVVVRGVRAGGQVFAAESRVLGMVAKPFRQLYLSVPDKFEERSLRKVPRIEVDIDANLGFAKELPKPEGILPSFQSLRGRVTDLSRTGIAFESAESLPFKADLFVNRLVDLQLFDDGESIVTVMGEAKSCRISDGNLLTFGVAVERRNQEYADALGRLILASRHIKSVIKGENL